ncbi:MAG: hypothetical protein ABI310_05505 [Microbacteriaceae bacterium]
MSTGDDADARHRRTLDPRYDPAFQRGYSGGKGRSASPVPVARPAVYESAADESAADESAAGASAADEFAGGPPALVPADEVAAPDSQHGAPRSNPYLTALWILGIAFIAIGIGAQFWAQNSTAGSGYDPAHGTPLVGVLASLAYSLGGPLITVGLATVVGLLFLAAVRFRPRRGPRSRSSR